MSKRGRRNRAAQQPHKDKYADKAAKAQVERAAVDRRHATRQTGITEATTAPNPEG